MARCREGKSDALLVSKQGRKVTYVGGKPGTMADRVAVACSDVPIDVKAVPLYYYEVYLRCKPPPASHRRGCRWLRPLFGLEGSPFVGTALKGLIHSPPHVSPTFYCLVPLR